MADQPEVELDDVLRREPHIPVGFAHGSLEVSDTLEAVYKVGTYYDRAKEMGSRGDDSAIGIARPIVATALPGAGSPQPFVESWGHCAGMETKEVEAPLNRHNFLRRLHEVSGARTYVEIGVNDGRGLALSRVPTVAVDPAPKLTSEIHCDLQLVKATSDGLFAREAPLEHLGGLIDLGFIDGMHLLEYALRDFINVERYSEWYSVIVLDDVLPRTVEEAARNRRTSAWAGDVYKMIAVLERYRPDLRLVVVDTEPTGILVVFGADPGNRILRESYDAIIAEYLVADPQPIPDAVLDRRAAIAPRHLIDAPFWPALVAAKTSSAAASYDRAQLLSDVEALIAGRAGSLAAWRPDASAPRVSEAAPAEAAAAASRPSRTLSRRLRCAARRVWSTVRARALHRRAG